MIELKAGGGRAAAAASRSFATAAKLDTEHLNIISGGEQEEEEEIRRAPPPRPSSCIITTGNSQRKNSRGKKTLFILSLSVHLAIATRGAHRLIPFEFERSRSLFSPLLSFF